MKVQDIAERAFADVDGKADPAQFDNLRRRISKGLQRLRRDGAVTCERDGFGEALWSLAMV